MGEGEILRNCQRYFCELGRRAVTDKGAYTIRLFVGRRPSEGSKLNQYGFDVNKGLEAICEASGCHAKATDTIAVKVGTLGVISLLLCNDCVSKFQEVTQTC